MRVLFKFTKDIPSGSIVVDTTSSSGDFRELSPFVLRVLEQTTGKSVIFENLWQYSKVYKKFDGGERPLPEWYLWRADGWFNNKAIRYPMGKGTIPEYSFWQGKKLNYIEARKTIYASIYATWVGMTDSFRRLGKLYSKGQDIILLDYDAYDHQSLGMSLKDVINNPNKKMGHSFVLMMMLIGELDECINST